MKILVVNNSGNVGKSFLSRELFYNMFDSDNKATIEVETHNSSSTEYEHIKTIKVDGDNLAAVFDAMLDYDDYVVDVGASQIIPFFKELQKSGDFDDDDIDLVIVPVTADNKIQNDSLKTLKILDPMSLKNKTRVIFNRVDSEKEISDFITNAKKLDYNLDTNLMILNYDAINEIDKLNVTIHQLANSSKDYKALAKAAAKEKDTVKKTQFSNLYTLQKYAKGITNNIVKVYALLLASK